MLTDVYGNPYRSRADYSFREAWGDIRNLWKDKEEGSAFGAATGLLFLPADMLCLYIDTFNRKSENYLEKIQPFIENK